MAIDVAQVLNCSFRIFMVGDVRARMAVVRFAVEAAHFRVRNISAVGAAILFAVAGDAAFGFVVFSFFHNFSIRG